MAESSSQNSLFSSENKENEKNKRVRKGNFKPDEEQALFQAYSKVKSRMEDPRTSNSVKSMLWKDISTAVSQVGVSFRTDHECRVKWGNLHRNAKCADLEYRKSLVRTGGGSPTMPPIGVLGDVASLYAKQPSFSGITGALETTVVAPVRESVSLEDYRDNVESDFPDDEAPAESRLTSQSGIKGRKDNSLKVTRQPGCPEVIHPTDVNVEFIRDENKTLTDRDLVSDSKRQPKKRKRITQEDVWEAQIEFFKEQTKLAKQQLKLGEKKEKLITRQTQFFKDASNFLQRPTTSFGELENLLHGLSQSES